MKSLPAAAWMIGALGVATGACAPIYVPHPAYGQPPAIYGTSLRPAVGVWGGPSVSLAGPSVSLGSEGTSGRDLGASLETPITANLILRGQANRMSAEDMTLRRFVVDGLMFGPPLSPSGTTPYGALGFGWYGYDYMQPGEVHRHSRGIHGSGGLEHVYGRLTLNGEIQLHRVSGTREAPPGYLVSLLLGMKIRF